LECGTGRSAKTVVAITVTTAIEIVFFIFDRPFS